MSFLANADFSYSKLCTEASAPQPAGLKPLRLALLTDSAPQFFESVLTALAARRGYALSLYAPQSGFETEMMDSSSGLYAFAPDAVFFMMSTQALLPRVLEATEPSAIIDETLQRLQNLWQALRAHTLATLIQANWALPLETVYGDFERKVKGSPTSVFSSLNQKLTESLQDRPDILLCDVDRLSGDMGRQRWFDERLWDIARGVCHADCLPFLANRILDSVLVAAGESVKAIVLDLDNVLWGGIIGDDGLSGIRLGAFDEGAAYVAFQRYLLALKRRGILLAVVSKNDPDIARLPFRSHAAMVLKEEDIAVFIANWQNKADNLRLLQETLQISFDSMVFVDDSSFERHWIRAALPSVIVPDMPDDPAQFCRVLAALNLLTVAAPPVGGDKRTLYYQQEARRAASKASFEDEKAYLASLQMCARIAPFQESDLQRLAELSSRSHQFNLTARHDGVELFRAAMAAPDAVPLAISLTDKYGDYGLIAIAVMRRQADALRIDTLLMSCRVLGRGVEDLIMNTLVALAKVHDVKFLQGCYKPDDKNKRVKDFYARYGFSPCGTEADIHLWQIDIEAYEDKEHSLTLDVAA